MSLSNLGILSRRQLPRASAILAVTLILASLVSFAEDFPPEGGHVAMLGMCFGSVWVYDIMDNPAPIVVEEVYACMYRSAPYDGDEDGLDEVDLNLEIRSGSGFIEGVGDITIGLYGPQQPGHIEAKSADSDFPADMTLTTTKVYESEFGTYYGDPEHYSAVISAFPPIGTHLMAAPDPVPLRDEQGNVVGELYPDYIVATEEIPVDQFPGGCPLTPVPTLSEWGLIVLGLLVLAAGTVVFGRRRRAAAA